MIFRRLFSYLCCSALLIATFSHQAIVHAAPLSNVSLALNNNYIDHVVTGYALSLTTANQAESLQRIEIQFATQAGGTTKPSGLNISQAQFIQVTGASSGNWTIDTSSASSGILAVVSSVPAVTTASSNLQVFLTNITNSTHNACNGSSSTTLSDTCFATVTTFSSQDRSAIVDNGATTYAMQEDPSFTFQVLPVTAGQSIDALTTNTTSTATSISFGSVLPGQVHYVAQKLNITTNAPNGYTVYAETTTPLRGVSRQSPTSPFGATNATWSTPQPWMTPTGSIHDNNTAWLAGHTTDTRVTGWSGVTTALLGPIGTIKHPVATSTHSERSGSTITVVYAFGTNTLQSSDSYVGTITYQVESHF